MPTLLSSKTDSPLKLQGKYQEFQGRSSPDALQLLLFRPLVPLSLDGCVCWVWRSCIAQACPQLSLAKWDIFTPQKCFSPSEQTDVTVLGADVCYG